MGMEKSEARKGKSRRLVGLFAAALITLPLSGCDDDIEICYDDNHDNLCDDDGSVIDSDSYVVINGQKIGYVKNADSLVSDGSSGGSGVYKGGVGKKSGGFFGG
jgi:hypothetical protein